ncbi:hypothetical protein K466DRAFT_583340 [Polyporus arcularius HHB13444]|uniref:Uncharacterized protein n=1 Tax=Polyporus arcularius HHB13444 TaxID=1314778 RepID=A0A5C3PP74_9APHY|nr:hypothetical protein K466DRAFT_583340 [Polyporus arcularius HHB13444]
MYEIVHGLICPSFFLCLALLSVCVLTRLSNRHHACASKATQASEEKVNRPSSTDADGISPAESIVKEPMFIAPELLRSMTSMDAFRDDPFMVELFDRFMFWQQHMRPVFAENPSWNPQFISECLSAAVRHILAKHPDRDIAILPHFDLPGPDGKRSPSQCVHQGTSRPYDVRVHSPGSICSTTSLQRAYAQRPAPRDAQRRNEDIEFTQRLFLLHHNRGGGVPNTWRSLVSSRGDCCSVDADVPYFAH